MEEPLATNEELTTEERAKRNAIDKFIENMNKSFKTKEDGENIVSRLSDAPTIIPRNSTGLILLDVILGGGLGQGRICEIYGPESSGKTTVCLHYVAQQQRTGKQVLYIDTENAIVPEYAQQLGVNLNSLLFSQPRSAENALDLARKAAESGVVDTIVIDSVASLASNAALSGEIGDAQVGDVARLLSKALKTMASILKRNNVDLVCVNQERVAIGKFSPIGVPLDTTGGKALKYYASARISTKSKQIKGTGTNPPVGIEMTLKTTKNKTAPPFQTATMNFMFATGFDHVGMLWEAANKLGVVFKTSPNSRSFFITDTGEEFFKGSKDDAKKYFLSDPELQERVNELTYKAMAEGKKPNDNNAETSEDVNEETEED